MWKEVNNCDKAIFIIQNLELLSSSFKKVNQIQAYVLKFCLD